MNVCVCLGLMLCGRVVTTWLVTHLRVSSGHPPSAGLALSLGLRGAALVWSSCWLHRSGTSVWNRWTMSPSYVLLGAGTAQLALVLAYVLTGPSGGAWRGKWRGEPLAAAGRASLLIYIGHTLAKVRGTHTYKTRGLFGWGAEAEALCAVVLVRTTCRSRCSSLPVASLRTEWRWLVGC